MPEKTQKSWAEQGKSLLAAAGISIASVLSVTWGAIQLGENKIIRPYIQDIAREQFNTLNENNARQLKNISQDMKLVREMIELTTPDSVKRRAVRNVRESVWSVR